MSLQKLLNNFLKFNNTPGVKEVHTPGVVNKEPYLLMSKSRIRIRLKSYDHRIIDECCQKILDTALSTGAKVIGPIPLPTRRKLVCVTTSPHANKDAREHFQLLTHKRLVDIIDSTDKTIDSLMHLELPAGVGIEIRM